MRLFCHVVVLVVFILASSVSVAQGPPPHSQGVHGFAGPAVGEHRVNL